MSIVYDYLKQIKESKETTREAEKVVSQAVVSPAAKSRSFAWVKYAFVFLLCLAGC